MILTKDKIEQYVSLHSEIEARILELSELLGKIDHKRYELFKKEIKWNVSDDLKHVEIEYQVYSCGSWDYYSHYFPIKWLSLPNDEAVKIAQSIVDKEKQDREEKNRIEREAQAKQNEERDYQKFLELKQKFETQ